MFHKSALMVVVLNLFVISLVGCGRVDGPQVADVSGTVTLDGQPLPGVNIQFAPDGPGGSPSFGGTNQNGQYRLLFSPTKAGAMLGKHRVEITARETPRDEDGELLLNVKQVKLPKKYTKPGALTAEVQPGSNVINFDLLSK